MCAELRTLSTVVDQIVMWTIKSHKCVCRFHKPKLQHLARSRGQLLPSDARERSADHVSSAMRTPHWTRRQKLMFSTFRLIVMNGRFPNNWAGETWRNQETCNWPIKIGIFSLENSMSLDQGQFLLLNVRWQNWEILHREKSSRTSQTMNYKNCNKI